MVERNFRLPRKWSNKILREIAPIFHDHIVNISGWEDKDKEGGEYKDYFTNAKSYTITNYSGTRGSSGNNNEISLDLSNDLDENMINSYDVCFNHTTLEHIYEVKKAFSSICKISRDIVIIIVPFLQPNHEMGTIKDYWRFTPSALNKMFEENNMEVVYKNANNNKNAGIYLFYVGSKNPEKWNNIFDSINIDNDLGYWVGQSLFKRLKRLFFG